MIKQAPSTPLQIVPHGTKKQYLFLLLQLFHMEQLNKLSTHS